jgi:hypothetical protein
MNYAKLVKDTDGTYFVSDHNDEHAATLLDIILDEDLIAQLKENKNTFDTISNNNDTIVVHHDKINNRFTINCKEAYTRTIDISDKRFFKVVEDMHDALEDKPHSIRLEKNGSEYNIFTIS